MKFLNENGEIVEGELISPMEEQAIESFKQKLEELPTYLTNSNKQYIMRMLVKEFAITERHKVILEPEYEVQSVEELQKPSAETEYGDFPSPSTTDVA